MRRLALGAALAALLVAAVGAHARATTVRVAVGIAPDANAGAIAAEVERRTGTHAEALSPIPALVVDLPRGVSLRGIHGVRYVEPLATRRVAFSPNDPLAPQQWYLPYSGFYQSWVTLPALESIPVAVIDSGVDTGHPELAGRILEARSFVGGSVQDSLGHGTFVSGLIAAGVDNGIGITGLAPSAQLLVAKVVTPSRTIPVEAEARAIRWAVDNGARVINMSLGGIRDPLNPSRDTYSRLEADAIAYAVSNGVLVVAAVGNGDQAPSTPWKYASYPAALPHVLGVSALSDTGGVPRFSNRDAVYNDIAAPGIDILSIFPRPLTARYPQCAQQGYSSCGPDDFRSAQGTSFAAPQVTAAAAVLLSLRPTLHPEQVAKILERSARDLDASAGCTDCAPGRDPASGWGRLDVAAAIDALSRRLPTHDSFEANDDAGARSFRLTGATRRISATVDFWDDQDDVYAITLRRNQPVYLGLTGADPDAELSLALWRPGTPSVQGTRGLRYRARVSVRPGARQYLAYRAVEAGTYYVQVRMSAPGSTSYRLTVVKG